MVTPNIYHRFGINLTAHLSSLLDTDLVERAASVVERVVYWLENEKSGYVTGDGHKWIVNSYRKWTEQFTWLNPHQIGYIIRKLEGIGLLISARYHELVRIGFRGRAPQMHPDDQSKFYRVNWEMLKSFEQPPQWLTADQDDPIANDAQSLEPLPRTNVHDCTMQCTRLYDELQIDPNIQEHNNSVVVFEEIGYSENGGAKTEEPVKVVSAEIVEKLKSFGITLSTETEAIGEDEYSAPPPTSSNKPVKTEELAREAEAQGVRMTPPLMQLIASAAANTVRDAIAALKEARNRGKVKNPAGYLTQAIKGQWRPNSDDPIIAANELETFNRWFPIARQRGIVTGSSANGDRMMVYVVQNDCVSEVPFLEMLEKYPLDGFD